METASHYYSDDDSMDVRDARTEKRFFVDNIIIEGYGRQIGVYGIAVYTALCMHAKKSTQRCFPSHRTIAAEIDCSVPKVKEALRQLEELKLIRIESRYDAEDKRQKSNLYTLLDPPALAPTDPPDTTDTRPRYNDKTTMNNPNGEQSEVKAPPDGDSLSDDERLFYGPDGPPSRGNHLSVNLPRDAKDILDLAAHTARKRAEVVHPDWVDASKDGSEWGVAVDAFCALTKKDRASLTGPTRIKLAGIFQGVGAATRTTAPEVAEAIGQFKERYGWWNDDWPSDGFCQRLGMLLVPDAEPEPIVLTGYRNDTPGKL